MPYPGCNCPKSKLTFQVQRHTLALGHRSYVIPTSFTDMTLHLSHKQIPLTSRWLNVRLFQDSKFYALRPSISGYQFPKSSTCWTVIECLLFLVRKIYGHSRNFVALFHRQYQLDQVNSSLNNQPMNLNINMRFKKVEIQSPGCLQIPDD